MSKEADKMAEELTEAEIAELKEAFSLFDLYMQVNIDIEADKMAEELTEAEIAELKEAFSLFDFYRSIQIQKQTKWLKN